MYAWMWYVCVIYMKTLNGKIFTKSMIVIAFEEGRRRKTLEMGTEGTELYLKCPISVILEKFDENVIE